MATLPTTGENLDLITFAVEEQPGYTHKLDIDRGRVSGMTDHRDALFQAIYLILNVERYAYPAVDDWHFDTGRRSVTATFMVYTIYGELEVTKEVDI